MVPRLNLKVSVLSEDFLVIGWVKEKLSGPIGDKKSIPIPVALRMLDFLSRDSL